MSRSARWLFVLLAPLFAHVAPHCDTLAGEHARGEWRLERSAQLPPEMTFAEAQWRAAAPAAWDACAQTLRFVTTTHYCHGDGRSGVRARWQPAANCDLPEWAGTRLAAAIGGRQLLFVGDSLVVQQFLNARCELERDARVPAAAAASPFRLFTRLADVSLADRPYADERAHQRATASRLARLSARREAKLGAARAAALAAAAERKSNATGVALRLADGGCDDDCVPFF